MANVYVRSGAAGTGDGSSKVNAYTTLAAALTAKAAGDSFWAASDHAETQASAMTLTSPGTSANPCFIYCVDFTGSTPPASADLRTTATITTTGANALSIVGSLYAYGIAFQCGTGSTAAVLAVNTGTAVAMCVFEACQLALLTTVATSIDFGNAARNIATRLINTTLKFGAVGQSVRVMGSRFEWKRTASAIVGSVPTNLFTGSASFAGFSPVLLEGVDLSALGSGKTIVGSATPQTYFIKDCLLGASVTVAGAATGFGGPEVNVTRSDSGATNYRCEKYSYTGTETTETTIVRSGGASDGATAQARKIVTTANSRWTMPFDALPITVYVDQAGVAYTVTLEGTINAGAVPKNDEIWLDVEYLGASGNPQGSFATGSKADNLATGSNLTASTATWNGGGSGAGWSPFQLSVTFTPQQAGWVTLYVKAAKASTTYYVDPRPTGINVVKTYQAGAPSPFTVNERDLTDTSLDSIEEGIAA